MPTSLDSPGLKKPTGKSTDSQAFAILGEADLALAGRGEDAHQVAQQAGVDAELVREQVAAALEAIPFEAIG